MTEVFNNSAEPLQARTKRASQDRADQSARRANALVQEQERPDRQRLGTELRSSSTPISAARIAAGRVVKRVSKRWILRQTIAPARAWRAGQLPHAEPGTVEIDGWRLRRVGVGEQAHWLYSRGRCEIRDRGSEIFLSDGEDPTAIRAWLTLAAARFGPDLELTGTALLNHEFRRQAAIVAVDLGLNVEQLAAEIADEQRRRQAPSLAPAQVAEPPSFRIVKTHDPRPSEEVSREAATIIDTSPQTPAERMRG